MLRAERDDLREKREQYRRLIDWALRQMNIDDIRQLVREMEDQFRPTK